jgi:hypothetical protein
VTNNPTPDPAEQAARDQWQAWLDQAPAVHWSGYGINDTFDDHQILAVIHTTEARRKQILRAIRRARIPLPPSLEAGMLALREVGRQGKRGGPSRKPGFIDAVVTQAWTHRDEHKTNPTIEDMTAALGVSRTTYTEWLADNDLDSADIKIAAAMRTIADGLSYLRRVQRMER